MSTEEKPKVSTRVCPCGSTNLIKLESLNSKHCADCGIDIEWPLEKGQKSLNGCHRSGRQALPALALGKLTGPL